MHGTLSDGIEVNVPVHEACELYGTLKITHVTHTFDKIEVVKGTTVFSSYEEKYTKIDDAKMIKEAEHANQGQPPKSPIGLPYHHHVPVVDPSRSPSSINYCLCSLAQITHVTRTFDKIEVLKGDGGVGTILKLTLPAVLEGRRKCTLVLHLTMKFLTSYVLIETGTTVFSSYEEMYAKVDDKKMIKEAEVISGGYLDLGISLCRTRFEIIETSKTSCITKTTIEYDANEEDVANFTYVSILPMISMMKDIATYLLENTKS
ncbi:hypothetical protein RJ640_016812 [Escallonia rubra]|uniref:Bet v I/Major latex protein domain-containing protein n=1 Tax=Escallonia rubra TaxID=112253 RepID=A0AA88R4S5_9ASTE|nr:hypothetical protein RJ640_016812 [Escallonia rubra]